MEFAGTMELPLPLEQAWAKLTDVKALVPCLPDAEKIEHAEEDRATCVIRPGFAFVRGTLHTTIERKEMEPQKSVVYRMFSKGVGSSSEVMSRLEFEEAGEQTKVAWKAEVTQLGGLLKAVPKGLIRGAAQKVIEEVWSNVATKVVDK